MKPGRSIIERFAAGASVWATYGCIELLFALFARRLFFPATFTPPSTEYILSLALLYPLTGGLIALVARHRLAPVLGLVAAFIANAIAVTDGPSLVVSITSAVILLAAAIWSSHGAHERLGHALLNGWATSLLLIAPLWASREIGYQQTIVTKAIAAAATIAAIVIVFYLFAARASRSHPLGAIASLAGLSVLGLFLEIRGPRFVATNQPPPRTRSPNVLLVVMDTVRADHLSVYGYGRRTTPALEEFAERATVYRHAYAPSNMTLSTHASLFTGKYASEHGAHYDEGWTVGRPLPPSALTLAELLSARGYATASIASNFVYLGDEFGLSQGFQYLDARPPRHHFGTPWNFYLCYRIAKIAEALLGSTDESHRLTRDADTINASAFAWLDQHAGRKRPFLLVVNYMDAHAPCIPPARFASLFAGRDRRQPPDLADQLLVGMGTGKRRITPAERAHLISQYDGSIAYIDESIARLVGHLRELDAYDDTLIIITSDHGEAHGERGVIGHGRTNYDDETRVPLIVKSPQQQTGAAIDTPVSTIDIWSMASGGTSTFAPVSESFPMRGRAVNLPFHHGGTAMIADRWKLIANVRGGAELYDLAADPAESLNLSSVESKRVTSMVARLAEWRRGRKASASTPLRQIDPEALRSLRALGYIQ